MPHATKTRGHGARISTVDVARAAGVHPNTVRLYETWGFLPPVMRSEQGWRCYHQEHVDQMILARLALHGMWPGRRIRNSAAALVRMAAEGKVDEAQRIARAHLGLVRAERRRAEEAASNLERWARGEVSPASALKCGRQQAAAAIDATVEQVRNWERNGLVRSGREPDTGRRLFGQAELGRLRVIRELLHAGYSVMAIRRMTRALDRGANANLRQVLDTPNPGEDVLTAFDRWLSTLAGQEERARKMLRLLQRHRHVASKRRGP